MDLGFIGLGNLGKVIAKRFISQGVKLIVWNRSIDKAKDLDAEIVESPKKVAKKCNKIFINLFDSNAVREVLFGNDGILKENIENKIIIDSTTNHFEEVLNFHEAVKNKGGFYIESPVLGSVVPASQGMLTILVSGNKEIYEKNLDLLKMIGSKIFFLEKIGLATKMKLINNLLLGVFMAGISEALVLAEKIGVPLKDAVDILLAGAGNSTVLNAKKDKIVNGDFAPHFSSSLIYKDLHYLQDLAYELKTSLFTGSSVKSLYALTFANKCEQDDFSVLFKLLKELNKI